VESFIENEFGYCKFKKTYKNQKYLNELPAFFLKAKVLFPYLQSKNEQQSALDMSPKQNAES
jgi:hypothetical protein